MNDKIQPTKALQGIIQYTVAGVPAPIDLKLDMGDTVGPDYSMDLTPAANSRGLRSRYAYGKSLEASLAQYFKVSPENVLVTAGADEALERICKSMITIGDELITAIPTFPLIDTYASVTGATVIKIPWPKDRYPIEKIIEAKSDRTKILMVVSPNNPTGQIVGKENLLKLAENFSDTLIVLDLAYIEYADFDLTEIALGLPNVLVIRSFSKAWGLAGARVGYAIGPQKVIGWMRRSGPPNSIAGTSLYTAQKVFEECREEMTQFVSIIKTQRAQCIDLLIKLGVDVMQSEANFVSARFKNAKFVWQALSGLGIAVRYFPQVPELSDMLRITLPGDQIGLERLFEGLKTILNPEVILFDLDGVIADSSKSYRKTVIETAKKFGVSVTPEMITKAKSEGSANDDWELTYRFISNQESGATLSDVTSIFEELYQGMPAGTGFCKEEILLSSYEFISALSKRRKLGVVTGRPKQDATRFLESLGIADFFSVIITREDAPLKPDPSGICSALDKLECKSAWMLGDTPDDIRAARSATSRSIGFTVLPVGILAPWDEPETMTKALNLAGAGVVFNGVIELEELI